MPDNYETLTQLLNNMHDNLSDKLDGVHRRLDTLNGRVYRHEAEKADKTEVTNEITKLNRRVSKLDTKVWKILLFITTGAAGGAGAVELIKSIFGG